MTGGEDDDAPTRVGPAPVETSDDATEAIDLPEALIAAIADPEELPLAPIELDERTLTEVPIDALEVDPQSDPTRSARPRRMASDERPVPIPVPVSDEYTLPVPLASDRPVPIPVPVSAELPIPVPVSAEIPIPAPVQAKDPPRRAALISAPPLALPDLSSEAPIPVAPRAPAPRAPSGPVVAPPARTPPVDDFDGDEKTNVFVPAQDGPSLPRGRLKVIEGESPGKTWYLNRARTQLGRGADNDIVLLDINVSRQHLRIDRHAQGFRVVDLDSGNGTQLNDRRVQREELFDGDRIRLGEHLIEFATLDGARPRVKDRRTTDHRARIERGTQQRRVGIPRAWIIAWSIATFIAVFGTMYVTRSYKAKRARAERMAAAQQAFDVARQAESNRQWHAARDALQRAQTYQPTAIDYATRLAALNTEIRAEKALRLMKLRMQAGELTEARLALGDIPAGSVYRAEAQQVEQRLIAAEHDRVLTRARAEHAAGRTTVARQLVDTVLKATPTHPKARALRVEFAAPVAPPSAVPSALPRGPATAATRRATTRRTPRARKPSKQATAQLTAGDAAYRAGRFADAQAAYSAAANAARGDAKATAQRKAVAASTLASALPAAEQADRNNNIAQAVRAYEKALKADRVLGGRNMGRIRGPLAGHLCRSALQALSRRQLDRAARLNARALQLDPNHKQARKVAEMIKRQQ